MTLEDRIINQDILSLAIYGFIKNKPFGAEGLCQQISRFLALIKKISEDEILHQITILHIKNKISYRDNHFFMTKNGEKNFIDLIQQEMSTPIGDYGRMMLVLKLRFNHMLNQEMQEKQILALRSYFDKESTYWRMLEDKITDPYCQSWVALEREHAEAQMRWMARLMPF